VSTQDESGFLKVQYLEDEFERLAPPEWKDLPMSMQSVMMIKDDNDNLLAQGHVQAFMKKCEGETFTDADILEVFEAIKKVGTPIGWLLRLGCLNLVDFPEGQDPTVKEFFEGEFDASLVKKKVVILAYPMMEK